MTAKERELETWWRRPLRVTVKEHCNQCSQLKEGVERRQISNYWPSYRLDMVSCSPCFEQAKQAAAAEALGVVAC